MGKYNLKSKLLQYGSINYSGVLPNQNEIPYLKEKHYYVIDQPLDGDAPKEFIGAYIYHKNNGFFKKNIKSWPRYIAKSAEKWYPIESLTEFLINKIGEKMGICMNETELVFCNGQIRFLSKYFLNKNERLMHGAEICGTYLDDKEFAEQIAQNKKISRDLFTFNFISKALEDVFGEDAEELKFNLVKMIAFDSLVGSNDRHFYNWGVIINPNLKNTKPKFAPVYDSARGLFWNYKDDGIIEKFSLPENEYKVFIEKYARKSTPRIGIENVKGANHFDLIGYLVEISKEYNDVIKKFSSKEIENKMIKMIDDEYGKFLIHERKTIIEDILKYRFKKVRKLLI